MIKVGSERYEAPECMFQPHLVDVEQPGVAGESISAARCHIVPGYESFLLIVRTSLPDHSASGSRHPCRALQAYRAVWGFFNVPWIPIPAGEGDEAAVSDASTRRRWLEIEGMSPC